MHSGKLNIVTDGQFGSTGKGLVSSYLAAKHRPRFLSNTNMANAGHTAVNTDGTPFIAKALPSASIMRKWIPGYDPWIIMGSTSAFTLDQLFKEIEITGSEDKLVIHRRAIVITDEHKQRECVGSDSTKHLASTMQGCGAALSDKIMRRKEVKLAENYIEINRYVFRDSLTRPAHINDDMSLSEPFKDMCRYNCFSMHEYLDCVINSGHTILHEGAQGFSLDINHGHSYPTCTSRGTTAMTNLADLGLAPRHLGDVYLVIRPYPIRVGNVIEDGAEKGNSGGCYPDQQEISWSDVARLSGMPNDYAAELTNKEKTTVTKRVRRVFTFSRQQLKEAVIANGATKIAINFMNYVDWSCYGQSTERYITPAIADFIKLVEDTAQLPVTIVGTGPQYNHVIELPNRS